MRARSFRPTSRPRRIAKFWSFSLLPGQIPRSASRVNKRPAHRPPLVTRRPRFSALTRNRPSTERRLPLAFAARGRGALVSHLAGTKPAIIGLKAASEGTAGRPVREDELAVALG